MSSAAVDFTPVQYDLIYNLLSFVLAAMGAATVFFWFQVSMVARPFKNAILVSSMVTFIACYHYFRMFNSFNEAYTLIGGTVVSSGVPFNDAYRYVDWVLTVPLLLMELIMVMQLEPEETSFQCAKLGSLAALMVILGYPGEVSDDNVVRWVFWILAMIPFLIIVHSLFFGLRDAVARQPLAARGLVSKARYVTVISWCTYPIVFLFPMFGLEGAGAVTAIQIGYSISDVIAKPIMGLIVWRIAMAKSFNEDTLLNSSA